MLLKFLISLALIYTSVYAQTDRSVIIVGAGIGGYGAARRLMENGFTDITILEATHRIGGRIVSMSFSGGFVDMGAQWVHGQQRNSIYEMVSPSFQFGTTPVDLYFPTFVISNGTTPRQADFQLLYSLSFSILDELYSMTLPRGSLGDNFITRYDQAVTGPLYRHIDTPTIDFMRDAMHKFVNGYFGSSSWFDISHLLTNMQSYTEGHQFLTWRREGFRRVFDFIAGNFNINSRVLTNKVVTNIRYNTNDPNSRSVVTCADGTVYTARHVIFTASLGVLQRNHVSLFTPALPARKVNSINNMSMGNVAKYFMEFTRPWWITPGQGFVSFVFMWSDAHRNLAISTNRRYLTGIYAIYAVDQFPNVLQVYLSGPDTLEFEQASTDKLTDDMMWLFDMFLPHLRPIPRPINIRKTSFLSLNMFFGSYAYPSVQQERALATIADLASTITAGNNMPMILFAGEATSSTFQGYAHGAMDTGHRAADEIIAFHR